MKFVGTLCHTQSMLLLSGNTLLRWWHSPDALKYPCGAQGISLPGKRPPHIQPASGFPRASSAPMDLLTRDRVPQNSFPYIYSRWQGQVPGKVFPTSLPNVYAPSSEFCLFQQARRLSVPQTAALGCELAGTYRFMPKGETRYDVPPAASVSVLKSLARKMENQNGIKNFRSGLRFVLPRLASPLETTSMLLLCLPNNLGGFGIETPLPNYEVTLSPKAARMLSKKTCRCDLYFPQANIDLEYDSYENHTGKEKLEEDAQRRAAIEESGIRVITLTFKQVETPDNLEIIANSLFRASGKRFRPRCRNFEAKQEQVWQDLLFWRPVP